MAGTILTPFSVGVPNCRALESIHASPTLPLMKVADCAGETRARQCFSPREATGLPRAEGVLQSSFPFRELKVMAHSSHIPPGIAEDLRRLVNVPSSAQAYKRRFSSAYVRRPCGAAESRI